ncbi:MAG: methyltransferase domain-containing protein [Deltaproteobacteria bacterium]|nr:methyltransferase domain-containing protein [Deltaproteobacteria bacterium]
MNLIDRTLCAVSGHDDLEPLYTFTQFPIFMGCLDQPETDDLKQDMSWWISRESGLIQLKQLLPLDVLYPESHGAGAVGAIWEKHHKAFAQFLSKSAPTSVFEVGGAHGILAGEYKQFGKIPWTILEPNPTPVVGCEARFIKGFFDDKFAYGDPFDTVVHSHVLEHIYEPDEFMRHLSGFMDAGKHLIFSLPNMKVMLERKYNNCINFEHTVFLTEPYVEFLLAKHGFRLLTKEYFMDDHSIFYAAVRDSSVSPTALTQGLYNENKGLFRDYIRYHEVLIENLNDMINAVTQPVYLFGAHIFAQYLIAFGLETRRIVSLLDNDSNKQGKRLYGTSLLVESPNTLRDVVNPVVILKAGVYSREIKDDILDKVNRSVKFLE